LRGGTDEQRRRWLPSLADGSRIGTLAVLEESDGFAEGDLRSIGEPASGGFRLSGRKAFVPDVAAGDLYVGPFPSGAGEAPVAFAVVEGSSPGVSVSDEPGLDPTKRLGTLALDGVRIAARDVLAGPGAGRELLARLLDVGAALVTAEAVGAAEGALRLTADY